MTLDHSVVVALVVAALERGEMCPSDTECAIREAMQDEQWVAPRPRERRRWMRTTGPRPGGGVRFGGG